ncbi:MAG: hypothetical protein IJ817_01155 [Clostridia bacterium]|nr:hypothetical protein [Clostridia bacterium]
MENKRKNHSLVFKGLMFVLAFALTIVYLPFANVMDMVRAAVSSTDYTHMTIGTLSTDNEVQTVVNRGAIYEIPNAYIAGNSAWKIGTVSSGLLYDDSDDTKDVTLVASSVTVKYNSNELGEIVDGASSDAAVTVSTDAGYTGSFTATKLGAYTITYAYSYTIGTKTYRNSYDFVVTSELADAEISFADNNEDFLPKIYDLTLAKDGSSYKDLKLSVPNVLKDGEEQTYSVTTEKATAQTSSGTNYVLVEVFAPNGETVAVEEDAGKYYISGETFEAGNSGAGTYTVKYSYYADGEFTIATTKTVKVYEEKYYTNYKLVLELGSTWSDNGQTGVASKLPAARGVTATTTTPASESVDVYYTVKVYYKSTGSTYDLIDVDEYNTAAGETVFNDDGTLVDPTEFKPLKDGSYSFVYTITDVYGNTVSSTRGLYEFTNVEDSTVPTPIAYDASTYNEAEGYVDASDKLATRANPSGIVVYAIGMDDNVSKVGDENVVLRRNIMTSDTVSVLSITDYNDKNLVFNYEGYEALRNNNYLINKQTASITSEDEMVAWLKDHGYLIVVDNGNKTRLYNYLKDNGYTFEASVTDADTALAWFKSEDGLDAGFAFIDTDKTFGATTTNNGTGYGQYYVHYVAKDAAGNEKENSLSIYVTSFNDDENPEITFSTTLSESYLPTSTVTFDAPTASDNRDTRMKVNVLYRYLDDTNAVVTPSGELVDLTDVLTTYANFAGDGYVDITDADADTYSIDLTEAGSTATKLQIVVYAYDDLGNVGAYVKQVKIANVDDTNPPRLSSVKKLTDETTFEQGTEIALPTIVVDDDAASYLTYKVAVDYTDNSGNVTGITVYDYDSSRKIVKGTAGSLTVNAGTFNAAYQGDYTASIAVKDSTNKTIVVFEHYDTTGREIVQPPVISTDMTSKTVELDENPVIEIPAPTISYELADSVDYEDYVEGTSTETYVVRKVWTTNYGTETAFVPTEVGTYNLQYDITIDIYNRTLFAYNDEVSYSEAEGYTFGGYYTNGALKFTVENGAFVVTDGTDVYTIANEDGTTVYTKNGADAQLTDLPAAWQSVDFAEWFAEFRQYNKTSDTYTITVQDTIAPKIAESTYDYPTVMTVADFQNDGLEIKPIEATDASGINVAKSKIVLSWKRANGTTSGNTGSKTYEGAAAFAPIANYTATATDTVKLDGAYTITYTVYDKEGNYTTKAYTVYVGDNEDPVLTFDDDFVETSHTVGTKLKIDLSKINVSDNNDMPDDYEPIITLTNSSTGATLEYEKNGTILTFDSFDTVGTYTLKISVEDQVGHVTEETFSIDVATKTKDATPVYKVVGIILIVLSVLILVGVIVYFIIAKVKLDKELKKK